MRASNSKEIKEKSNERSENNNESELEKKELLSSVTHSFLQAVVNVDAKCNSRLATKLFFVP